MVFEFSIFFNCHQMKINGRFATKTKYEERLIHTLESGKVKNYMWTNSYFYTNMETWTHWHVSNSRKRKNPIHTLTHKHSHKHKRGSSSTSKKAIHFLRTKWERIWALPFRLHEIVLQLKWIGLYRRKINRKVFLFFF